MCRMTEILILDDKIRAMFIFKSTIPMSAADEKMAKTRVTDGHQVDGLPSHDHFSFA